MVTVTINFDGRLQDYEFASSKSNSTTGLIWQKSNIFKLNDEGLFFFFKKDVRNGSIVKSAQVVNCSGDFNCFAFIDKVTLKSNCYAYISSVKLVPINSVENIKFEIVTGTN